MCNTMLGPVFLLFFYFVFFSSVIYKQIKKACRNNIDLRNTSEWDFACLNWWNLLMLLISCDTLPASFNSLVLTPPPLHPPPPFNPMPAIQPHAMDDPQILTEQCMLLISQLFRTLPSPPTFCLLCAWLCFAPSDLCVDNVIVHLEPMKCSPNELRNDRHVRIITNSSTLDTHCVYMQKSQQFWLPSWIVCCFIIVCSEVD